jgi:hypothetical protein
MRHSHLLSIGLCLLAASAQAEPPRDNKVEARGSAREQGHDQGHGERAGEHMRKAGDEAKAASHEVAEGARQGVEDTKEKAKELAEETREKAHEAKEQAREAMHEAHEQAREAMEEAREQTKDALDKARENMRDALHQAADSLDDDKDPEARRQHAREREWHALQGRMHKREGQGPRIDPAVSSELRHHARRTARLERIRALALDAHDQPSVEHCDALIGKERERHEQHMSTLLAPAKPSEEPEKTPAAKEATP